MPPPVKSCTGEWVGVEDWDERELGRTSPEATVAAPQRNLQLANMIVVIRPNTPRDQIDPVIEEIQRLGYEARPIFGSEQTVVAAIGDERTHQTLESLTAMPQVEQVLRVQKRYKMVSRQSHPANSVVDVAGIPIGGPKFVLMAGPCSVESEEQLLTTARAVKAAGATILRGGAYKPRTSPYEFQGLGKEGLRLLDMARKETGLKIITEVLSEREHRGVVARRRVHHVGGELERPALRARHPYL
jgi:3-deoxy-7-phosphoheptulonate synthase